MIEARPVRLSGALTASAAAWTSTPVVPPFRIPTKTPVPQIHAASTLLPVIQPTPRPPIQASSPILPENSDRLGLLALLGRGRLNGVTYSPDGRYLAAASTNGISIYNADTVQEVRKLDSVSVLKMAISRNGKYLASSGADGNVYLWDVDEGRLLQTTQALSVALSPDGNWMALGLADGLIRLEQINEPSQPLLLEGHNRPVTGLVFSPNGSFLASFSRNATIRIWDPLTGKLVHELSSPQSPIESIRFSPDGQYIAAGSSVSKEVVVWQMGSVIPMVTFANQNGGPDMFAFTPGTSQLVTVSADRAQEVYNLPGGELDRKGGQFAVELLGMDLSPDGKTLVTANTQGLISFFNNSDGSPVNSLLGFTVWSNRLVFSSQGQFLVFGLQVWRVADGSSVHLANDPTDVIWDAVFSPDETLVTTLTTHHEKIAEQWVYKFVVQDWQLADGLLVDQLEVEEHLSPSSVLYPDRRTVINGTNEIKVWRFKDSYRSVTLTAHKDIVNGIWFSPTGQYFTSASDDGTVKIWEAESLRKAYTLNDVKSGVKTAIFSNDEKLLASGADNGKIYLWQFPSLKPISTLDAHNGKVVGIAFSPDNQVMASVGADKAVRLWRLADGTLISNLVAKADAIRSIAFSPDGTLLAVGLFDGSVELWGVK